MKPGDSLLVVRHGETEWSRTGRHTGRTDIPLTQHGREQAARLRPALAQEHFALVLTSPLTRARDTCALAGFADAAELDDDLAEWDYGDFDGKTLQEIQQVQPGWDLWRDGPANGETLADVARRAGRVITRCRAVDGDVALFAHGHILRVLTACWLEFDPIAGRRFVLGPASPSVLGFDHTWTAMRRWNQSIG